MGLDAIKPHDRFQNSQGDLAIKLKDGDRCLHKFCAQCCKIVRDSNRLRTHCNKYHAAEDRGFLQYGGRLPPPNDQCYENFNEYLADPTVDLRDKLPNESIGGRPKNRKRPYANPAKLQKVEPMDCWDEEGNFRKDVWEVGAVKLNEQLNDLNKETALIHEEKQQYAMKRRAKE